MLFLSAIGNFFSNAFAFLVKNPIITFLIIIGVMGLLLYNTCQSNIQLKKEKEEAVQALLQEEQRSVNNLLAMNDTIRYLREDSIYKKRILAAKQSEINSLDRELVRAINNVKTVTEKKEVPKLVYVTDINSEVSTSDVETKLDVYDDTLSIGINTENQLFRAKTQTWFRLVPDSTQQKLAIEFIDKFGGGKPSKLEFNLNFKLSIVQTEMPDGSKRVYIKPTDMQGNAIDPMLLGINNVKGVDFIDIPSSPPPPQIKKKPKLVVGLGPQGGVTVLEGKVVPYAGVGLTIGINLLR